jgi:predicted DCC family thiol-disulfide oxidoreductase YuxK
LAGTGVRLRSRLVVLAGPRGCGTEARVVPSKVDVMQQATDHPVVLFDGVCNLCNGAVSFAIDRDPASRLRFVSLQSEAGRRLLEGLGHPVPPGNPESILFVEGGRLYQRSGAALRIARHLSGAWPLFWALLVVPRPLRDLVYRWVASHRYRWFGKADVCRVPTPELRARFIE